MIIDCNKLYSFDLAVSFWYFVISFLQRRFKTLGLHQYEPKMGEELLWGVKNGDLDKVRELVETKVCNYHIIYYLT